MAERTPQEEPADLENHDPLAHAKPASGNTSYACPRVLKNPVSEGAGADPYRRSHKIDTTTVKGWNEAHPHTTQFRKRAIIANLAEVISDFSIPLNTALAYLAKQREIFTDVDGTKN